MGPVNEVGRRAKSVAAALLDRLVDVAHPGMRLEARPLPDRDLEIARLRALLRRLAAATARRAPPAVDPGARAGAGRHAPWDRAAPRGADLDARGDRGDGASPGPGAVYLDTETTGLAGGTGTYVFLVGLAAWRGETLTVTQYFLGDLDGEAALLHAVAEAVADARPLVTFNGRTFDLPLLETRYLLARAAWWGEAVLHHDLYPVARALWHGRAADCRLSSLERALLGVERGDDLPGALVPQVVLPVPPDAGSRRPAPALCPQPVGPGRARGAARAGGRASPRPGSATRSARVDGGGSLA